MYTPSWTASNSRAKAAPRSSTRESYAWVRILQLSAFSRQLSASELIADSRELIAALHQFESGRGVGVIVWATVANSFSMAARMSRADAPAEYICRDFVAT